MQPPRAENPASRPAGAPAELGRWALAVLLALLASAGSGRGSDPAPHRASDAGEFVVEVEHHHGNDPNGEHRWELVPSPDGSAMRAGPERNATREEDFRTASPRLSFRVDFARAGPHYLWVRGYAEDSGANSVHVGLGRGDGGEALPVTLDSYRVWAWTSITMTSERAVLDVAEPGEATLEVWMREDGFVLDKILLTREPDFVPEARDAHAVDATPEILWSASMETGDLSEWSAGVRGFDGYTCGGEFNSGGGNATVTDELAHTGRHAAKLVIGEVDGDQGARLFRGRCESEAHPELYYSAWLYFPDRFDVVAGWWNVIQWKSERDDAESSDPFWILDVNNRGDGAMHFTLRQKAVEKFYQSQATIPSNRWFHVEAYYRSAGDASGEIIVWQDGSEILRVVDVPTRYPDGDTRWSVNNYTSAIAPDPAVIYVDDAAISTSRVGPRCHLAGERP